MDRYKSVERRADDVVSHALAWLSQLENGPFFLWVHLYDAHDPYDPPAPFKAKFAAQPYDGEIAYADSAVGKLIDELRKHGLYDETLIAVMADHGESLGAHGENTHGIFLYDETLHVPLLFKLPASHAAGKKDRYASPLSRRRSHDFAGGGTADSERNARRIARDAHE